MIMKNHVIRKITAAIMSVAMLFSVTAVPTVFAEPVDMQHIIHNETLFTVKVTDEMLDTIADGFAGDTDGNGVIDVTDATRIQLHLSAKSAANVLSGMPLCLADVNFDGVVDVTDATMVQLYSAGNKDKAGKTGIAYLDDEPTDGLRVKCCSNLFPEVIRTFSPDKKQVTVTYKVKISEYKMENTEWHVFFDRTKLRLDGASNKKPFPICPGNAMVNLTPRLTDLGLAVGNATDLNGYYMDEEDGSPTVYATFTFDVKDGASGTAYVYFELCRSVFLDENMDEHRFCIDNKFMPELAYLKDRHTTEVTAK